MTSMLQQCPPWTLRAWPPLLWQVGRPGSLRLQHMGTQITHPGAAIFSAFGQTLWASLGGDADVGVAWDWVVLTRGVVAMADPMAVVTNLRLIDDEGEVLGAIESARHVNCIVHALPWQLEVERALNGPGGAAVLGEPGRSLPALPGVAAASRSGPPR